MSPIASDALKAASALKLIPRRSHERGHAHMGWLNSYHTFSFANYQDAKHQGYGPLRVINEDRVQPSEGFGQHQHREFEIWSYVVDGELEHRDSMGNLEIMRRGDVQMTSAGTGIAHSEYNRNTSKEAFFLQIWGIPSQSKLPPKYYNRHFSDDEKRNKLVRTVAPVNAAGVEDKRNAEGPAPVHASITMYSSILSPNTHLTHTFASQSTKAYVHLIMRSGADRAKLEGTSAKLQLNKDLVLEEGDASFVTIEKDSDRVLTVENVGTNKDAEWLLFEMED